MHKIKLKTKRSYPDQLIYNLKNLNFIYSNCFVENEIVQIIFHSQYQIERFLNITNLDKYSIGVFVEKFDENHKISFIFSFEEKLNQLINSKLESYLLSKK